MQIGIRPCWVFDGCPPDEKEDMLMERFKRNIDAKNNLTVALNNGDTERAFKMASRSTVITNKMLEDAKTLIKLLGLPCIDVIFFQNIITYRLLANFSKRCYL